MKQLLTQPTWQKALAQEWEKPYMQELEDFLESEAKQGKQILPPKNLWFEALNVTSLDEVKVLILGQDPYPTIGHAHGLCFSVLDGVKPLPKSLKNIYKELFSDCGIDNNHAGNLNQWAQQGVLLLNTVLTVEEGKANAHKDKGWETFTNMVIELMSAECEHVVFVLWGAYAQKKSVLIDATRHLVIQDPHPSPLSAYRGFWGSKPFSRINDYLIEKGKDPIEWGIEGKKGESLFDM